MRLLHRLGFALWLGLLALATSGVAQNQLSLNVITATLSGPEQAAGHYMPDGTFMAGSMDASHDGHTHKGHADCALCGVVASMAAVTVPVLDAVFVPDIFSTPPHIVATSFAELGAAFAPYASRAPPQAI